MTCLFHDLNILHDPRTPAATIEKVRLAIQLGYDCVAINVDVGDMDENAASHNASTFSAKKKKKAKSAAKEISEPYLVPLDQLDLGILSVKGRQFRQFSRLTMTIGDSTHLYSFLKTNHPVVSKYDIIAVCPKNEQTLQTLATKLEVEIITFDVAENCLWLKRSNIIQHAIDRDISFELSYTSALCDSSLRRQVLSNARELYRATRGRNVILTSRAEKAIDMRAPLDVANLAVLFGRTPEDGKRAVTADARRVVLHAATRKTVKGVMSVQPIELASPSLLSKLLAVPEFQKEAKGTTTGGILPSETTELGSDALTTLPLPLPSASSGGTDESMLNLEEAAEITSGSKCLSGSETPSLNGGFLITTQNNETSSPVVSSQEDSFLLHSVSKKKRKRVA